MPIHKLINSPTYSKHEIREGMTMWEGRKFSRIAIIPKMRRAIPFQKASGGSTRRKIMSQATVVCKIIVLRENNVTARNPGSSRDGQCEKRRRGKS